MGSLCQWPRDLGDRDRGGRLMLGFVPLALAVRLTAIPRGAAPIPRAVGLAEAGPPALAAEVAELISTGTAVLSSC